MSRTARRGTSQAPGPVRLAPAGSWLPAFTRVLLPWLVVLAGRRVCLLAQRVPPLVRLVRVLRRRRNTAAQALERARDRSA